MTREYRDTGSEGNTDQEKARSGTGGVCITNLAPEEYQRLADWFRAREQTLWDEQIDQDSAAGKLDLLFSEADNEAEQGLLCAWPLSE